MEAVVEALGRSGLAISHSETSIGRGIVAARSFSAGEVLLRANPAAVVVQAEDAARRCHHCLQLAASQLKRCSACGHARYCSVAHQREAWKTHRCECRILQHTKPRVPGTSVRLLARLLDLAHADAQEAERDASATESLSAVRCLVSNLDLLSAARAREFGEQAAMLCGLLAEAHPQRPPPSAELATSLLATLACNGHTVCDEELQPVGLGLYPLAALVNHDCNPSAAQTFEGTVLVLRARGRRRRNVVTTTATLRLRVKLRTQNEGHAALQHRSGESNNSLQRLLLQHVDCQQVGCAPSSNSCTYHRESIRYCGPGRLRLQADRLR